MALRIACRPAGVDAFGHRQYPIVCGRFGGDFAPVRSPGALRGNRDRRGGGLGARSGQLHPVDDELLARIDRHILNAGPGGDGVGVARGGLNDGAVQEFTHRSGDGHGHEAPGQRENRPAIAPDGDLALAVRRVVGGGDRLMTRVQRDHLGDTGRFELIESQSGAVDDVGPVGHRDGDGVG
ncbi:hypothetical protein D2E68_27765, partial [Mycobacteroides abscessus]